MVHLIVKWTLIVLGTIGMVSACVVVGLWAFHRFMKSFDPNDREGRF